MAKKVFRNVPAKTKKEVVKTRELEKPAPVEIPTSEVYETDVLVIGGGFAGMTAAVEASDKGADVIIVDKGPLARSGSSGLNSGYWFLTEINNPPWPNNADGIFQWLIEYNEGIGNQRVLGSLAERMFKENRALWNENTGSLCLREPSGKVAFMPGVSGVVWAHYPWTISHEIMRRGIRIFERTMITRLLTYKGAVVGATGVDIKTGGFIIFKAKSTILATGSFGWLYGWQGVSAFSVVQPECTGDGHALTYYAGAELLNMEFGSGEMRQFSPATLAGSFGAVCAAPQSPEIYDTVCNKDGEYFLKKKDSVLEDFAMLTNRRGPLYEAIVKQVR
ncbi:MAG: FAD-binding protein, partial [Dehalococcoidales bacterium]|nr:FAD-binding protein [Dehalococcoidales bacterium]